jgi:hyperosmotically inducible periplasmic protein
MEMKKRMMLGLAFIVGLGIQTTWARAQVQATDARTLAAIQDKIYHTNAFEHGQVTATYEKGVATLTGTVDNLGSLQDAERAASKVDGVTRVVNNIQVRAEDFTPAQMAEEARKHVVTYYAYGIFDNIQLEAQADKLIVSGQVTDPFKKSDLGKILERVKGVATLENNLEVLPVSSQDDQLRAQVARAIYGSSSLSMYGNRSNPPVHIIVKNGHVTLEGAVGSKMDKSLAEFAARSAGLSFSVTNNLRVG